MIRRGLTKGRLLGKGTGGKVYLATSPSGGQYAVKRGIVPVGGSDLFVGARELDMTVKSYHPCVSELRKTTEGNPFNERLSPIMDEEIVRKDGRICKVLVESRKFHDDTIHLVFDLAKGGNLFNYRKSQIIWSPHDTRRIMAEILIALEYIHSMNILHRDLKPENVVMKEEEIPPELVDVVKPTSSLFKPVGPSTSSNKVLRAKLADFGLAKPFCRYGKQTPRVTTCWYRAPEVSIGVDNYDGKIDIWSAGCIMYELYTGNTFNGARITEDDVELVQGIIGALPYAIGPQHINNIDPNRIFRNIFIPAKPRSLGSFLNLTNFDTKSFFTNEEVTKKFETDHTLRDFCELLINMLQFDASQRMTASQCLAHRYFDPIRPYIDFLRNLRPPGEIMFPPVELFVCPERTWMVGFANDYYRNRLSYARWYTDRILFQAIDIYDRILFKGKQFVNPNVMVTDDVGQLLSRKTCHVYFIACIYFAFKYFSTLVSMPLAQMMPRELNNPSNLKLIEKLEPVLVNQTLAYDIYHDTIYDVHCRRKTPKDNEVASMIAFVLAGQHADKTPAEAYEYWLKNEIKI